MRALTPKEIDETIDSLNWATIITVKPDGQPYAIEATPFFMDDKICFMINPKGTTKKNLDHSDHVLLKYTTVSQSLDKWCGISCFGRGGFVSEVTKIARGWELLGKVMGADYSAVSAKFVKHPENTPLLMVSVLEKTGRCNWKIGEIFPS
ncbi:MAG: hypothetical protein LBT62_06680 [Deltaproteobacteria bacterium]|jgi:hypothetical protein|nr:hypothetical protein [Deltaproteobacteria bacterium]